MGSLRDWLETMALLLLSSVLTVLYSVLQGPRVGSRPSLASQEVLPKEGRTKGGRADYQETKNFRFSMDLVHLHGFGTCWHFYRERRDKCISASRNFLDKVAPRVDRG